MASDVDIANLALLYLETAPIVSFADSTETARSINNSYALLRDKLQRVFRWNFTRVYAQLPASTAQPLFEYEFAYQLPADYLRLEMAAQIVTGNQPQLAGNPTVTSLGIGMPGTDLTDYQSGRAQDYRIVGNKMLYAHYPPPIAIIYAQRVVDPNMFDSAFVESLACYIAYKLAGRITGSAGKKRDLLQDFQISLREAVMTKSIELPPETIPDDTWVLSRIAS